MKRLSTDHFLALGMALTADKATMERRVRNIFARKSSANAAKILSLALCIALGVGCFTTACRPAREAEGLPSPLPLESEEQSQSVEKTGWTEAVRTAGQDGESFLAGLSEAERMSGPFSTRIERAAVSIDDYKTLAFDADVIVPETDGYGIARLERHVFSDAEYRAYMDYLEPGGIWKADTIDGEPFSIEAAARDTSFRAVTPNTNGNATVFIAKRGGRTVFYSKYDSVLPKSSYTYAEYLNGEMEDFSAAWPVDASDARTAAERLLKDLGIEDMVLDSFEKAVSYNSAPDEESGSILISRGWSFFFVHEFNGLDFGNVNCGLVSGNTIYDPLDYQMPMWERLSVYVDETGIAQIDWQDALDITETVLHNVSVVSPEMIADRLTERLQRVYSNGQNTAEATFRVTAIRLGAAAIGEYPLPESIMSVDQGLMVPCWEVETVISGQGTSHTTVYVFNAVDGGTLVGKEYEEWMIS